MYKVAIIMSSYNGENYIEEQIKSIIEQIDIDVDLYIRDDCSNDNTMKIVNKLIKENGNIFLINNGNINLGPAKSFLNVLFTINDNYDYYAFSDQDDIWDNNKIISAIQMINNYKCTIPTLYCSNQRLLINSNVVENTNYDVNLDFYSTLVRNKAVGCTMVFNNELFKIIRRYNPNYIEMHDIWLLKVCQIVGGKCIYDNNAYFLYRQHNNNVLGAGNSIKSKIKFRINKIKKNKNACSQTAKELLKGYNDYVINDEYRKVLEQLVDYRRVLKYKLSLISNRKIKCDKIISTLLFKIGILLNTE